MTREKIKYYLYIHNKTKQLIEESNKKIIEYKGIVNGEVISGIDFVKDFAAGFTNFFGGRSNSYEDELCKARAQAIREMEERAMRMGANAVVGVDIDYETISNMLMITASGTAVVIEE